MKLVATLGTSSVPIVSTGNVNDDEPEPILVIVLPAFIVRSYNVKSTASSFKPPPERVRVFRLAPNVPALVRKNMGFSGSVVS